MKASLWFYPNERKMSRKSALIPIYVRVILHGKKAEGKLDEALITPKEKALWEPRTMRLASSGHKVNKYINEVEKHFSDFRDLERGNLRRFTALQIRDMLLNRNPKKELTAVGYLDQYFASSIAHNPNLSKGTKKNYQKAIRHFKAFLSLKQMPELLVKDLTPTLAIQFKDYLLCASADGKKKGMKEPSAAGNIMKFKTVFSRAVDEGLLQKNPFKVVKLKHRSPQKPRLGVSQINALMALDLRGFARLEAYRDLFLFSCFTGLAYEDAHNLTPIDLINVGRDESKIYLNREKTDILTEVFLVRWAKDIINKYKGTAETSVTGRVLPQRSNQKLNDNLKLLSNMVILPFGLNSHTARHTFRQLLGEAGITDTAIIKRMMGHRYTGDMDAVYYQVTEGKLLEAKNKFEAFLTETLPKSFTVV